MPIKQYSDLIGPQKIIEIYDPETSLQGIVVIDNVNLGPAIGGVRFAPDVSVKEVFDLARAMTFKNAAAEIPHGGAKAAILGSSHGYSEKPEERKRVIESFARAIRCLHDYIPGPDMGTNELDMQTIYEIIGRATGRPKEYGGIPLDQLGLTGLGLVEAAKTIEEGRFIEGLRLDESRITIEGYGNVGRAVARFITPLGAKIIAVSDLTDPERNVGGVLYSESGLDVEQLARITMSGKSVTEYEGNAQAFLGKENLQKLHSIPSDIFVPAARTETVTRRNMHVIKTRLILQGANKPLSEEAEAYLHGKGMLSAPDYVVNAGGVIACAEEFAYQTVEHCTERIVETIRKNTYEVFDRARTEGVTLREAAYRMILPRILKKRKV